MRTTQLGQVAEGAVADELQTQGYRIVDRNWKTKVCEIDIVASKDKVIYFVEVKFRVIISVYEKDSLNNAINEFNKFCDMNKKELNVNALLS